MKIRMGFITNSSSADFVIGVKGELTEERIRKIFNVPEDSPFYYYVEEYAKAFMERVNRETTIIVTPESDEETKKKLFDEIPDDMVKPYLERKMNVIHFRITEFYDNEKTDFDDELLYYLEYVYKSDDLEIGMYLP